MNLILRKIFRIIVVNKWHGLLAFIYSLIIKELTSDGKTKRLSKQARNNKLTILVLSRDGFRSDIDCIVNTNEFRVLVIPVQWQRRLVYQFYPIELQKYGFKNNPDHINYRYKKEQKEIRGFLYEFLKSLYKRIVIDCIISPHHRWAADMDWGAVSTKLGVPHILIARDSQFASSHFLLNEMKLLFKDGMPKFEGKHVIVQSKLDIPVYVDTGYVKPERINSLGRPRMDDFIRNKKEKRHAKKERKKKVVFLPFSYNKKGTLERSDLFSYVNELHLFFIQFAIRYPEIDVVMKPKPKSFHKWKEEVLYEAIKDSNIDINRIPNLIVRCDIDIHSLFFESDVVCGLNTSALLEAAVIGLPIIIPYFKELQNPKYDERLYYRDAYHLFDIAKDLGELESLILKRLRNPAIDEKVMEGLKALFERYVSCLKGDATEKYVNKIKNIVTNNDS